MRRDVFLAVGGFDSGLVVWGHEDGELSLRLWTSGYTCLLVPAVEVAHLFRRVHPYQVDREVWLYNTLRVATVHFGPDRLRRVTEAVAVHNAFQAASARLTESDTSERRQQVRAARCYDDDWFFSRFGMDNV
jgi:GT2 family glycosyltransferase